MWYIYVCCAGFGQVIEYKIKVKKSSTSSSSSSSSLSSSNGWVESAALEGTNNVPHFTPFVGNKVFGEEKQQTLQVHIYFNP